MAVFPRGYIWPAGAAVGAAPPAVQSLTAAYVASTFSFEVHELARLICRATLGAALPEDPCLLVRVDVSFDAGVTWTNGFQVIAVPRLEVGDNLFAIDLPANWHHATWRIACRDMRADPDTTITVYADAVTRGSDHMYEPLDIQPLELINAMADGVAAWHDGAGAAAALGLNFALGPPAPADPWWIPVGRANEMEIWATTTGGPPTSIEIQIDESWDDGVTVAPLPAINSVVAGIVNHMPRQVQFQSAAGTLANGTYVSDRIPITPYSWIRLQAKRTGAAVNLLSSIRLFRV